MADENSGSEAGETKGSEFALGGAFGVALGILGFVLTVVVVTAPWWATVLTVIVSLAASPYLTVKFTRHLLALLEWLDRRVNRRAEAAAHEKSPPPPVQRGAAQSAVRAVVGGSSALVVAAVGAVLALLFVANNPVPPTPPGPSASDCAKVSVASSFPAPGSEPNGLTFDGKDLWTADNSGSIFQVNPGGQVEANYPAPDVTPEGITWDGHSFWLFTTNQGLIDHFRIRNGQAQSLGSIDPHAQVFGSFNHGLAWASPDLWWSEQYNVELLSTKGAVLRRFTKGSTVTGLAWDGSHLWLAYTDFTAGSSRIEEDTVAGASIRAFTVPNVTITSLTWAEGTLWAVSQPDPASPARIDRFGCNPRHPIRARGGS